MSHFKFNRAYAHFGGRELSSVLGILQTAHIHLLSFTAAIFFVLAGLYLGRFVFPTTGPTPVFPDFSASITMLTPSALDGALASTEALFEEVALNLRLTYQQCNVGFPAFWPEVEQTKKQFEVRNRGHTVGIGLNDLASADDQDGVRVAIISGQLYVKT